MIGDFVPVLPTQSESPHRQSSIGTESGSMLPEIFLFGTDPSISNH
jgi:hypothetical protein